MLGTPLSLRLGKVSLLTIIALYVATSLALALLGAIALRPLHNPPWTLGHAFRLTFEALWGLGELLRENNQSGIYYTVAGAISVLGVLLPLLLLGSFVFKLLRHDPIKWRKVVSLEDDPKLGAVLSVRCYPGTSSALGDLTIRVFARVALTGSNPRSIFNSPLKLYYGGKLSDCSSIPYSSSGFPCMVRVPLSRKRSATASVTQKVFDINGNDVKTKNLELIAIASGVVLDSGESFVSIKQYKGNDIVAGQPQWIDAIEGQSPKRWLGWDNFDGNAELVIFVYGSMMNRGSMLATLPTLSESCGPSMATLKGWKRSWNTGSDPADQPERIWHGEGGNVFEGTIVSLGLAKRDNAECPGALYRITVSDLAKVDNRERDYTRINVTGSVDGLELKPTDTVYTYVPTDEAQQRLVEALADDRAVLSKDYLRLVKEGFTSLHPDGERMYHEHTPRFHGRIETLTLAETAPTGDTDGPVPPLTS